MHGAVMHEEPVDVEQAHLAGALRHDVAAPDLLEQRARDRAHGWLGPGVLLLDGMPPVEADLPEDVHGGEHRPLVPVGAALLEEPERVLDGGNGGGHAHRGEDDDPEPEALEFVGGHAGRLSALHHVGEQRRLHFAGHPADLVHRLRGFHEDEVRARLRVAVAALDGVVQAGDRPRVRTRDDDEVGIRPVLGGGADLLGELPHRHHELPRNVAALLGRHLVFHVQPRHPRALVLPHRPHRIERVAVPGIGVRDHRERDRAREVRGVVRHLGEGGEAEIRLPEVGGRGAGAGHVHDREAGRLDEARGKAVIGAGRHDETGRGEQLAETRGAAHRRQSFPGPGPSVIGDRLARKTRGERDCSALSRGCQHGTLEP